ncbi:MAG: hypothetical protein WCJ01_03525 [Ignavibacteria bacterium]
MQQSQNFTARQKLDILKELLIKKESMLVICQKYQVCINEIYSWEKKLFYNESNFHQPLKERKKF